MLEGDVLNINIISEQQGPDRYWINDIVRGVKAEAAKKNIQVCEVADNESPETGEMRAIAIVIGYTQQWMETTCTKIFRNGAETIAVNLSKDETVSVPGVIGKVCFDFRDSVMCLLSSFKKNGRIRVAFIGCTNGTAYVRKRKEVFLDSCRMLGIYDAGMFEQPTVSAAVSAFLKKISEYDAVVCSRAVETEYILRVMRQKTILVSADIAIAGFGGGKLSGIMSERAVTINLDYDAMGAAAVKLHQFLQLNREVESVQMDIKSTLIPSVDENDAIYVNEHGLAESPTVIYRNDPDYLSYLQAEELLRNCDTIDKNIIRGLCAGKHMSAIADEMFVSQSSVKYRVRKMLTRADIKNRQELVKIVVFHDLL